MGVASRGDMAGVREGWKQKLSRYATSAKTHSANGAESLRQAGVLERAGQNPAPKYREAESHYMMVHGAEKGQEMVLRDQIEKGHPDATEDTANQHQEAARQARVMSTGAGTRAAQYESQFSTAATA